MASASLALQTAVFAALQADAGLTALLPAGRILDHVPQAMQFPYVTLGQSSERDWSTGSEDGREHILTLHVWSRAAGKRETLEILGAMRACLHERPLALTGWRLINLRHEHSDARRENDGETLHGILRLRAVTEPV